MKASPSLQINPLTELLVELGVMVACPGKERLVKVGTRGRDAKDAGNFDENYLYTLARLYDTAVLGNAYDPDRCLARRIARFMYDYSRTPFCSDDDRFCCVCCVVRYVAERIDIWQSAATERYIA